MSVYSYDKLIEQTRRLAADFRRTTGTMLPVSGEIARHDVSHHLDLELNTDQTAGYDAIGKNEREGLRIQIKSRVISESVKPGHRVGQLNTEGNWDRVILSLMDDEFEPLEMYEASRDEVIEAISGNSSRKKRGALSVAKFKIISELVWAREIGKIA